MKNIQVLLHNNQEVAETYDVIDGQLLTIQNVRGVNYELFNAENGTAPQNIIAKRVGQDLFIILDENEGEGSPDEIQPDVVIKDYYGDIDEERANGLDESEGEVTDATGIIIGLHENGKYYAYIPESAEESDAVSILADGDEKPQAIGGEELACGAVFFPWWGLLGLLPLLGVPFLLKGDDDKPVTPAPVDNAPKAENDNAVVEKDKTRVTSTVADNDTLGDGTKTEHVFKKASDPSNGSVTVNPDGTYTYTPKPGFTGKDSFTYTITDKDGDTSTATVEVTVEPKTPSADKEPVATDDDATTKEATPVTGDVTINDTLGDGTKPEHTFTKASDPLNGTVTVNPDGTYEYTPKAGFTGKDSFTYTITDKDGDTSTAKVVITVNPKPEVPHSELELRKTSSMPADAKEGDTITYIFTITNKGNVDLTDVKIVDEKVFGNDTPIRINDAKFTVVEGANDTTLSVGETVKISVKYPITQDDIDAGKVENTATVKGTDPRGTVIDDISDSTNPTDNDDNTNPNDPTDLPHNGKTTDDPTVTPLEKDPKLDLIKEVTVPSNAEVNTELTYTFTVTNIGNVSVDNITISDTKLANFTDRVPTKIIKKDGTQIDVNAGDTVKLAPGDKAVLEGKYKLTQADFDAGKVENEATVKGTDPKGDEVSDKSDDPTNPTDADPNHDGNPDDPTVRDLTQTPKLELIKADTLPLVIEKGAKIDYTFTITNKGNVTVEELKITDSQLKLTDEAVKNNPKFTISADDITKLEDGLQPNESITVKLKDGYTITQADIDMGKVVNTAKVNGKGPQDQPVSDVSDSASPSGTPEDDDNPTTPASDNPLSKDGDTTNDPTVSPVIIKPELTLTKSSEIISTAKVGDKIIYTFVVTNTGKVTVTDVTISDEKLLGTNTLKVADSLAPGKSMTVKEIYTITPDDVAAGKIVNTATVNGVGTNGEPVSDVSDSVDKNGNPVNDNGTPTADTTKLDDKGKPLGNNDKNDDDPTVTVLPKDKEPVAKDDDATTKEATPVTGDVTGNDTLGDGEKGDHTFAKATDPLNGTVTVNEDGTYEYTPKAGFTGKDSFEYTITDKDGDTSTAKVVITVDPKTPPTDKEPVAKDDTNKTTEGTPIPGDVTTNDELGDGDKGEHTFSKASDPLNGTVTVNPDGTYKYTPKAGFTGKDSFEYTITDKDGDTSTATVVITVDPKPVPVPVKVSLEGNNTVIEGDGKTLDFTAKLNKASTVDTLVKVKLDPTATNTVEPKDITKITYTDANGQPKEIMDKDEIKAIIEGTKTLDVTIKAGQTESPIKLEVADDEIYEKSEEIHFTIDSVENAVSAEIDTAKDKAQGTIKDESDNPNTPLDGSNTEGDKPTVSIAVDPDKAVAIEGEQPLLVFNVSQDNVSEVDTTVQVKFDPAKTEIKANDIASIVYENSTGKVVTISDKTMIENILNGTTAIDVKIPAGEKNAPAIMFIAADDEVYEGSEDVVLKIESADNANVDTTPAKGVVNDESNNPQNPGDGSNTLGDYQDPDDSATTPQDQTIDKPATEGLLKDDSEVDPDVELAVSNVQVNGTNVPIDTETPVMKNGKEIGTLTVKEDGSYIFDPAPDFAGDVPEVTYDIVDKNDNNKVLDSSKLDITVIPKDPTKVQVSIEGDNTVIEGDGKTLDFNVKLDKPSTKDTLVDVKVDLAKTNVEPKDITKITYTDETGQPKEIKDPAKIKAIIEGTEVLTINMKPGAEKTPIKLTVADDEVYEQSEDISLTISQATNDDGVTIGTNTAKGTIDDESSNRNDPLDKTDKEGDKPIVNISVDPDTVIEGDKQSLVFKVAYDQGQTSEKDSIVHVQPKKLADNVEADDIESITYENVNGEIITLTDPAKIKDFFDNGVDVKIPAGKDHAPVISILPKDDDVFEQSEPLTLAITEPTKDATAEQKEYTIGTNNEATGTVDDESTNPDNPLDKSNKDGDKPTVNIKATVDTATEPDPADPDATNQDLVFEVSYNKGQLSTEDSIVNVKPHDEDSVSPADIASVTYTKPDGTVETLDTKDEIQKFFDEGVNVKIAKGDDKAPTITVTAKDDNVYEVSEDLQLDISAPANVPATDKQYNLGVDNATGTINDEDNVSEPPAKDKHGDLPGVGIYATDNKAIEGVAGDVLVYEVRYQNGQTSTKDSIVHVRPFALSEAQVPDIAEITYTPAGSTETKTISNPDKILAFAKQGLDVTIPAGSDKAPVITITPKQDNVYEISEFLQLNIAKPVDANSENLEYQVIKPTARGTIYDEPDANNQGDKPQVSITIDPTQVNEGANTPLVYKVAYDNGKVSKFDSIVHVKPTLNGGDGKVAVEDIASIIYTDKDGNQQIVSDPVKIKEIFDNGIDVKIAEGKSEAPVISVLPKDDAKDEVTEILTLKITQPTDTAVTDAQKDYDIGTPTATGEILDNDVSIDITQIGDNVQPTGDVAGAEHNNENTYGTVDFKETPISGVTKAAVGSTVTITLSDGTTEITREVTVKAGTNGENTWDTGDNPFTADEMKTLQLNSSTDLIVKASVTENGTTITDTDKSELVHTRVIVDNPQSVVEGTDIINHIRLETAVAKETTLEVDFYSTAIDPKVQAVPGYDFGNTKYHLPWEADGVWHTLYGNTNPAGNLRIKVPAGETGPILLKMNTFADGQQELTETYRVKVKAINNPEYFVSDGDKSDAVVDTIFDSPAITVDNTDANVSGGDNSVVEGTGEVAKGNITVTNPQSVQALTMTDKNGAKVDVTTATAQNPVTIEGSQGTLKITGYNKTTGLMTYEFVQKPVEKEQHKNGKGPDDDSVKDSFAIELTSSAGTKINDSLDIVILDTAPVAKDDEDKVVEDIAPIARGNVVTGQGTTNAGNGQSTDDTNVDNGADGANGWVTGVKLGGDTSAPVTGAVATKISGEYGDLIMLADGRYQYKLYETPNPNDYTDPENSTQYQQLLAKSQKVHALLPTDKAEDVFTYTITDSDGDTSTATLKIDVKGIDDRTKMLTKTARVSEEGLTHGIADTTANGRPESPTNPANPTLDKTDSTVSTGQVIVIDPDTDFSQAQLSFTNLPNYLSTNGDKIAWKAYNATTNDYSTTGNDWVGYVDANGNGQVDAGEKAIIKLDIDDTPPTLAHTVDGAKSYVFKYKATLVNNIDHSVWKNPQDNNQEYWEDIEHLYVNPVLTYTQNGKAKSDVFKQQQVLVIEDDAPVGKEIVHNVDIPVDTIDISNLKTGFSHSEFTSLAYDKNRLHTSDIVATEYQDSKTYTQTINGKTYTQERKDEFDHKDHPDVWDEGLYWGLPTGSAKAKPSGYETLENPEYQSKDGKNVEDYAKSFDLGTFRHDNFQNAAYKDGTSSVLNNTDLNLEFDVTINGKTETVHEIFKMYHFETGNLSKEQSEIAANKAKIEKTKKYLPKLFDGVNDDDIGAYIEADFVAISGAKREVLIGGSRYSLSVELVNDNKNLRNIDVDSDSNVRFLKGFAGLLDNPETADENDKYEGFAGDIKTNKDDIATILNDKNINIANSVENASNGYRVVAKLTPLEPPAAIEQNAVAAGKVQFGGDSSENVDILWTKSADNKYAYTEEVTANGDRIFTTKYGKFIGNKDGSYSFKAAEDIRLQLDLKKDEELKYEFEYIDEDGDRVTNKIIIKLNDYQVMATTGKTEDFADIDDFVVLDGTINDDTLGGSQSNDLIRGDAGNDTLTGNGGNDFIKGGLGADKNYGGDGDDTIVFDPDDIMSDGGEGTDTLRVSGSPVAPFDTDKITSIEVIDMDNKVIQADGTTVPGKDTLYLSGSDIPGFNTDKVLTVEGNTGDVLILNGMKKSDTSDKNGYDLYTDKDGNKLYVDKDIAVNSRKNPVGTDQADTPALTDNADYFDGKAGDDSIDGKGGKDMLLGGAGNDTIYGGADTDEIHGGEGNDTIFGGAKGVDPLNDDVADDVIYGDGGSDTIKSGKGNDTVYGGDGNDKIWGYAGDDRLEGGAGNDSIYGHTGNDKIYGGDGDDTQLNGGAGNDRIYGDAGEDLIKGEAGDDQLFGGADNDTVRGGTGNDELHGNEGDDTLEGGDGFDVIYGDAGNDILKGGAGQDKLLGGTGNDVIHYDGTDDGIGTTDGGKGIDTIKVQSGTPNNANNGNRITLQNASKYEIVDLTNGTKETFHLTTDDMLNANSSKIVIINRDLGANKDGVYMGDGSFTDVTKQATSAIDGYAEYRLNADPTAKVFLQTDAAKTVTADSPVVQQLLAAEKSYDPSAEDNTVGYSNDVEFTHTDTGAGYDTLMFNPADDVSLNFNSISAITKNIEAIDMEDNSTIGDSITISASDVLVMTDEDNELFIKGDSNDTVELAGLTQTTGMADDVAGYDKYTNTNGATVYIDEDITNISLI